MMRWLLVVLLLLPAHALAHDLRPGIVTLAETDGAYSLRVVAPVDSRGDAVELAVVLPPGCSRDGARVRCERGLAGPITVTGMRGSMRTLLVVERGEAHQEWMLDASSPRVVLGPAHGSPPAARSAAANTALLWLRLGVEHIAGGLDHLAFVVGLLLVLELAIDRRLLLTITAFTVAHSLTLALAVLGVVRVPIAPVEACIAASVLLVAREATHREPTAIRRWPYVAAAGFGLIHGLGFAAALAEVGLPRARLAWSLAWFNAGIELGQLAAVAIVVGLAAVGRRLVGEGRIVRVHAHRAACYALGALAASWLLARTVG